MAQLQFCCEYRYFNPFTIKNADPIPRIKKTLRVGRSKIGFVLCSLLCAPKGTRSREDRIRMRAGVVPVEKIAF